MAAEKPKVPYLVSKGARSNDPLLTRSLRGNWVQYTRKQNNRSEELAHLYHGRILQNAAIMDARDGIYTWIMKGDLSAFLRKYPDLSPSHYTLYSVRTCTKQEIGTIHQNLNVLTSVYDDDNRDIVAAGELKVENGVISFNLLSGTYMYKKNSGGKHLLKIYARNDNTFLKRLGSQKKTNAVRVEIADREREMFGEIAQRVTDLFLQKGIRQVVFLASNQGVGGKNIIKNTVFVREAKNDPILCEFFEEKIVRPGTPMRNKTLKRKLSLNDVNNMHNSQKYKASLSQNSK